MVGGDGRARRGVGGQVVAQPLRLLLAVDDVAVGVEEVDPPGADVLGVAQVRALLRVEVVAVARGVLGLVLVVARHRRQDVVEAAPALRPGRLEVLELAGLVLQVAEADDHVGVAARGEVGGRLVLALDRGVTRLEARVARDVADRDDPHGPLRRCLLRGRGPVGPLHADRPVLGVVPGAPGERRDQHQGEEQGTGRPAAQGVHAASLRTRATSALVEPAETRPPVVELQSVVELAETRPPGVEGVSASSTTSRSRQARPPVGLGRLDHQ